MKRFIVGLGVAASVLGGYKLLHTSQPAGEAGLLEPGTAAAEIYAANLRDPGQQSLSDAHQAQSRTNSAPLGSSPALPLLNDSAAKPEPSMFPASDDIEGSARMDAQCSKRLWGQEQREQAARDAEPRDEAWAYSTAQLLQQFAASHPLGLKFQAAGVDCRTTFCIVKARGPESEVTQAAARFLEDLLQQSWNSFTGNAHITPKANLDNGVVAIELRLQRRKSDLKIDPYAADAQMDKQCWDWYGLKENRKEAALQAEPKDPEWAYLMEEQLQQFAASHKQGVKFEITSIECRTTFCDIKAIGKAKDALVALQEVMRDARNQPWNTFSALGSAGGSSDGNVQTLHTRLLRK